MFCFPYLRVGDQGFGGFEVVGTPLGGLGSGLESGGGSGSVLCGFCVGGSAGPRWLCSCIEAGLHLSREGFWWEAFVPGGGELRFPKTIPRGDIGV